MGILIITGGSLSDGSGSGASMKDLAPTGYDYYILSDGSGDYASANTGLTAILGMGAGHYRVYIGPGDFSMPWSTAWPVGVTMTLRGAGKYETQLLFTGSTAFGSNNNTSGLAEVSDIGITGNDWTGWINPTVSYDGQVVLADGTLSPSSWHDCRFEHNSTSGPHGWNMLTGGHVEIYNCEITGNHGTAAGDGLLYLEAGSHVRNCSFFIPDGSALMLNDNSLATGCSFSGIGTGADDILLWHNNDDAFVSGCSFNGPNSSNIIRCNDTSGGTLVVRNCNFYGITQANAFDIVAGTVNESSNVFSDTIS